MRTLTKIPLSDTGVDEGTYIEISSGSRGCTIRNVEKHVGGSYAEIPTPGAIDAVIATLANIRKDIRKDEIKK